MAACFVNMEPRFRSFEARKVQELQQRSQSQPIILGPSLVRTLSGRMGMLPTWDEVATLKSFVKMEPVDRPKHAVILVHGLNGQAEDLDYVHKLLWEANVTDGLDIVIHATKAHTGKTYQGVATGGERIAADIHQFVQRHPELSHISIVGFSLGGLFARYAAGRLYDSDDGTIAGLKPRAYVAVASPHLGVRDFGVYRFFHEQIQRPLSKVFAGNSGAELFFTDEGLQGKQPLLVDMSEDIEGMPFFSALASFERRSLYGNVENDFMVSYGTAVLDPSQKGLRGQVTPPDDATIIDEVGDPMGCRVWFQASIDPGMKVAVQEHHSYEEIVAHRLRSLGWDTVGIKFDLMLPVAHNLIVSKMRNEFEWVLFNRIGRRAAQHLADHIVSADIEEVV